MDFVKEFTVFFLFIAVTLNNEVLSGIIPTEDVSSNKLTNFIPSENENFKKIQFSQSQKIKFKNFQAARSEKEIAPYVVEISRGYIKFKTTGFDAEVIALTPKETEGVQQLSLALVELLNESQLSSPHTNKTEKLDPKSVNPVITITNSGISLRFASSAEDVHQGSNIYEGQKYIIWKFVSEFAKNIFEEKLKYLNLTNVNEVQLDFPTESSTDDFKQFENFIATIWKIMKLSVKYTETNYKEWTTFSPVEQKKVAKSKFLELAIYK